MQSNDFLNHLVKILENNNNTRNIFGWSDNMSEMIGGVYKVEGTNSSCGVVIRHHNDIRNYTWHIDDIKIVQPKKEIMIKTEVKPIQLDIELLDI